MNSKSLMKAGLILAAGIAFGPVQHTLAADGGQLVAVRAAASPTLDGKANDAAWKDAKPLVVTVQRPMDPNKGASTTASIRATYTDTHIYILVTWDDATQSDTGHKTWLWNADKNAYDEAKDREDMAALAFAHTGPFTADMLSGEEAVWDVWHWKAFRTNPQGHAMDKTHRYSKEKPAGKANKHPADSGGDIYIARPEDAGDTVEKKQPAPATRLGERVPQYLPGTPSGSAADVQAKGAWADGKWTVEFARKLNTGQADDTAFDPARTFKMGLSTHDNTGEMDKASGVIELRFAP